MEKGRIIAKIKDWNESERGKSVYIILIILLTALISFGLGYMSRLNLPNAPAVVIERGVAEMSSDNYNTISNNDSQVTQKKEGNYVASKRGKKYYPVGCPASKNLKPENLIYFQTTTSAEASGYSLSSSC